MNVSKRFPCLRKLFISLIACTTLLVTGCGGSGDGGGTGVGTGSTVGGGEAIPPVQARTLRFPTFSSNSKLTVVANYQTATETPNTTGSATVQISDAINRQPLARLLSGSEEGSGVTNRCGYTDIRDLNLLLDYSNVSPRNVSSQIRPRFQELAAGSRENFFIVPAFRDITGEKVLEPNETLHCTIFAEVINDQPVLDRQKALEIAEAFDSNNPQRTGSGIYDQVRAVFGSEWNQNPPGGNDGDQKVVLFFFSSQTLGSSLFGYVSPVDGQPNAGNASNKGEIVYLNADKSNYQILATLSHEFQHLINQNEKESQQGLFPSDATEENISVNEGLSGLAEEICGYTFESGNNLLISVTNDYLEKPERHEFFDFFESGLAYGQGYLFFKYVREHFGDQLIRAIATDTSTGLQNLDKHLPNGFAETFRRWTVANYATNLSGNVPSIYRYPSGFRTDGTYPAGTLVGVNSSPLLNSQSTQTGSMRPWSASYLSLENKPGLGLTAIIIPAAGSPTGALFESTKDEFTSLDE